MTNNETLIRIFADTSKYLRSHLPELLEAEPPPSVIHRYIEAWLITSALINDLADGGRDVPVSLRHEIHSPDSLMGSLQAIERQLQRLTEDIQQIKGKEGGTTCVQEGDRHE